MNPRAAGRLGALREVQELMDESEVDEMRPKPPADEMPAEELPPEEPEMAMGGELSPEDIEKLKAMLAAMGSAPME